MTHVIKCTALIALLLISTGIAAMETVPASESVNLAILISGTGSNMAAILDAIKTKPINGINPCVVISNRKTALGLEKAQERGVPTEYIPKMKEEARDVYCEKLIKCLKKYNVTSKNGLICLAGFMVLLDKNIVQKYKNRILNIHPAHPIENYPGANAIERAFSAGEKEMGATVHFVDEGMDTGKVVMHKSFNVEFTDSLEDVELKMHKVEHEIFPECVKLFAQKRLCIQ